ncbi:hypothetical protein TNIN_497471 [Trichonephila inaurata madagascariensis]|uniref:Uncharacterized protein n=1 Tax=Trichonephila inaurata madagascariensis TaxID=2747483 RepID=A0A8X6YCJ6_9ARAC|nr:hypothetical protein TNIN_497471 [Trichonephila inaurata madagascariensis]
MVSRGLAHKGQQERHQSFSVKNQSINFKLEDVFDSELSLRSIPSVLFDDLNFEILSYKLTIGTFHSLL